MKFRMLMSALLLSAGMFFVVGFTEAKKVDSPAQVVNNMISAMKRMDCATVARLCSGKARKQALEMSENLAKLEKIAASGDENTKRALAELRVEFAKFDVKIKSEKINGNFAEVVTVVTDPKGKTDESTRYLKKIDGEWKIIDGEDYKPAGAKADTPSEVLMKMIAAVKELDFDTVARLSYGRAKRQSEKMVADMAKLKRQLALMDQATAQQVLEGIKAGFSQYDVEIKSEKIEGDYAVIVTVAKHSSGTPVESKRYLKKVDGEWKVIDDVDYQPAAK